MDTILKWLDEANIHRVSSELTKRQKIFDLLCDKIEYDFNLMNNIQKKRAARDPVMEFDNVFLNSKGICSSISQAYHVMLHIAGIMSKCVCCTDNQQLHELVYFHSTLTLDDPTNAILNRKRQSIYFNYSIETAITHGQGIKAVLDKKYWITIPDDWIKYIVHNSEFSLCIQNSVFQSKFTRKVMGVSSETDL